MEKVTKPSAPLVTALVFVAILIGCYILGHILIQLKPVLTPFVVALVLAYLSDPLVEKLNQHHKMPRVVAVTLVFVLLILLLVLGIVFLVPTIQRQLAYMSEQVPAFIQWIQTTLLPWLQMKGIELPELSIASITETVTSNASGAAKGAKWLWQEIFSSGLSVFTWLMNVLIVFVVTFYLLRDWDNILGAGKRCIPNIAAPTVIRLAQQCDSVLSTFVRGQLTVMAALAAYYTLGLILLGLHFSLLLGVSAGLLSIVPYLGSIVGLGSALVVAYFQFDTWWPVMGVLAVFGIGNILEGMVLTPALVGEKLGLHPVVVIFAILAGGQLFGFIGVVIALPLTAMLVVVFRELMAKWQNQDTDSTIRHGVG